MTRGQRRTVGAVGCLIAVASLAWAVASASGSDGNRRDDRVEARRGSTTVPPTTDTTLPLLPVTGGEALPATTTVPPAVPLPSEQQIAAAVPTTTPPASAGPPPPPPLTTEGAILTRPASDSTRPIDKARGCNSAADPGWKVVECGALKRDDVVLLWVVESKGSGLRALVLRERTAGQWAPVLAASDDSGTRWSRIGVRGEDVSGDGRADLVFGFHSRAADKALLVDVVEGPGVVTVHRGVAGGSARVAKGELHTWAALADGAFEHETIKVIAGAWRVAARERVQRDAVPPSMI